jgi:hypothetical protein
MRFFRDAHGYPRCEAAPPHQVVGWFLEQDIQGSRRTADELLAEIEGIASGCQTGWSGTGNAFHLALTPAGAEIECLWDEAIPACRVGLAELGEAVRGWAQLLGE